MTGIQVENTDEFLAEDNDMLRDDLVTLWKITHALVKATRATAEHNHPSVYANYDAACHEQGEEPRQAKILKDGRP